MKCTVCTKNKSLHCHKFIFYVPYYLLQEVLDQTRLQIFSNKYWTKPDCKDPEE
jgi:hypothetical protein